MNGEGDVMRELPAKKPLDGQNRDHDLLIAELKRRQDNRMALSNHQVSLDIVIYFLRNDS